MPSYLSTSLTVVTDMWSFTSYLSEFVVILWKLQPSLGGDISPFSELTIIFYENLNIEQNWKHNSPKLLIPRLRHGYTQIILLQTLGVHISRPVELVSRISGTELDSKEWLRVIWTVSSTKKVFAKGLPQFFFRQVREKIPP